MSKWKVMKLPNAHHKNHLDLLIRNLPIFAQVSSFFISCFSFQTHDRSRCQALQNAEKNDSKSNVLLVIKSHAA